MLSAPKLRLLFWKKGTDYITLQDGEFDTKIYRHNKIFVI